MIILSNHLKNQTSPYLLQHAENPVDWYPWCEEAFRRAREEEKPIFLSIGYSTCHWCHVMAHESFEDPEIAELLNKDFISIKVDKEERPDIDSIYMTVCQAFTGNGGWPTSIFMTAEQKPFFAGTYFPKTSHYGIVGFRDLLLHIRKKWVEERETLLRFAEECTAAFRQDQVSYSQADETSIEQVIGSLKESFDATYGGFGSAPKFPAPHQLLFLLQQYQKNGDEAVLHMVEITLRQMYAGGLFDHVGYGFCRYSTDRYFLVPHFEKMLYDNALLILAYCKAYDITKKPLYLTVAQKTAAYIRSEMTSLDGAFYSAQDADSDGEEGKYYVFTPEEIIALLGEAEGNEWNQRFGITKQGNFEGKSIPNLLHAEHLENAAFDKFLPSIREYRKNRTKLHTDDKILTAWNSLMIAAFCALYRSSQNLDDLKTAKKAQQWIEQTMCRDDVLYVSYRNGKRGEKGFLTEYACYLFALLALYDVTLDKGYLNRAEQLLEKTISHFYDAKHGGFYLYGTEHETLFLRPKECYDGAIPSGNALMTYHLIRLQALDPKEKREAILKQQLEYLSAEAQKYPAGYTMFFLALSDYLEPPTQITVAGNVEDVQDLPFFLTDHAAVRVVHGGNKEYPMLNQETTFYVCKEHACLPPMQKQQWIKQQIQQ